MVTVLDNKTIKQQVISLFMETVIVKEIIETTSIGLSSYNSVTGFCLFLWTTPDESPNFI